MVQVTRFLLIASLLVLLSCTVQAQSSDIRVSKWTYLTSDFIDSSPALGEGMVFIGSADGFVYALDQTTGLEEWRFQTGDFVQSTPSYSGGLVFVGSDDFNVYALNASNGEMVWSYNVSGKVRSSPKVVGGVVYVGSSNQNLYAFSASDGEYLWSYPTGGEIYSSPAIYAGMAYIGSNDGKLYAINITDGSFAWSYQTDGAVYSSPDVVNNIVYFGSSDNSVYAVNAASGTLNWTFESSGQIIASPEVSSGILWVGSLDSKMYALNSFTGALLWSYEAGAEIQSSPYYSEKTKLVYFGCNDNKLYALDSVTGKMVWWFTADDWVTSKPVVFGPRIYFGSYDGRVYCLSTIVSFISSPLDGATVTGATLRIQGQSYADAGVSLVEIKIGADPVWRTVVGTESWSYTWGISGVSPGSYLISVRTTDDSGEMEPEPYKQISVTVLKEIVVDKPMTVEFPQSAEEDTTVDVVVKDENGGPVPFAKLTTLGGKVYYGDENGVISGVLVESEDGELEFTVTKSGYYVANQNRLAIKVQQPDYTLYIVGAGIIVVGGVIVYVWKKRSEPGY